MPTSPTRSNRSERRRAAKRAKTIGSTATALPLDAGEAMQKGLDLHRRGQIADAEALYRQVLDQDPRHPDALNLLGLIGFQTNHVDDALILFNKAIHANPRQPDFYVNMARCHQAKGQVEPAIEYLKRAIEIDPASLAALNNLANLYSRLKRPRDAYPLFETALSIGPDHPEVLNSYAACLLEEGELDRAADLLRRCTALAPDLPAARLNEAVLAYKRGDINTAREHLVAVLGRDIDNAKAWLTVGRIEAKEEDYRSALESFWKAYRIDPQNADALADLANCCRVVGHLERAEQYGRDAVRMAPHSGYAKLVLGQVFIDRGRPEEAKDLLTQALAQDEGLSEAYITLAMSIKKLGGDIAEANALLEKSIALKPDFGGAYNNLGINLMDCCLFTRAIETYEAGLERAPDDPVLGSAYLMAHHYLPQYTAQQIFEKHLAWAERHAGAIEPITDFADLDRRPDRKLRLALISSSFRRHPVGYMTLGSLQALDRDAFDIHVYSGSSEEDDDFTALYRSLASSWTDTRGMSHKALAQQILADRIDIVIDLSGHAAGNRLLALAHRPAPINVKWVGGLFNTTGVPQIDYLLSDINETPEGVDHLYTEKIVRMPNGYVSYLPAHYAPDVAPLPMARNGHVTFACLNNISKISPPIAAVWGRIMERHEGSRLIFISRRLKHETGRAGLAEILTAAGIDMSRVELRDGVPHLKLLESYGEVDVALDPWPYSGGLTTCEALWMGVPVVTLAGPTFAGRHSVSHLRNVGRGEWVAESEDDYVEIVSRLCADPEALKATRAGLRDEVARSPLCDHDRFARALEAELRRMWTTWLATQKETVEA